MPQDRPSVAYVQSGTIPPSPPPPSAAGPLAWLRENLFRGPGNSLLTVLSILFLVWLVPQVVQWAFIDAVWFASSLSECREINAAGACWAVIVERFDQFIYGFYPRALRWRVDLAFVLLLVAIAYALFDTMPWRRQGLIFAATYPVIAYWLIWGGSVWGPLLVLAAPVVGWGAWRLLFGRVPGLLAALAGLLVAALWLVYVVGPVDRAITRAIGDMRYETTVQRLEADLAVGAIEARLADRYADPEALADAADQERRNVERRLERLAGLAGDQAEAERLEEEAEAAREALPDTVSQLRDRRALRNLETDLSDGDLIAIQETLDLERRLGGVRSRIQGTYEDIGLFGLTRITSRDLGGFLLAVIIGVAGITLSLPIGVLLALGRRSGLIFIQSLSIMFIEFIRGVPLITLLFVANSVLAYFFPPGSNLDLILRVVIMVTLFASAYMAEVIRGGLAALPSGQYEAADSLGLDYWKSMRLIILPQALKISIPNIVSTFIGLFKDTTLVVVIGLLDPIGLISTIRADSAWNGIVWEFYVFVGLFFFIVCFGMSRYAMWLEGKLKTDNR
ncbi:MAG: amino acid ABC transporter permease [Paracoccaceae bacterium]